MRSKYKYKIPHWKCLLLRCNSKISFLTINAWSSIEDKEVRKLSPKENRFNIYTSSPHKRHKGERDISKDNLYADICTTDLGQIGNNFTSFNSCIVIFINQQRLNNHKDLQESQYSLLLTHTQTMQNKDMHLTLHFNKWFHVFCCSQSSYQTPLETDIYLNGFKRSHLLVVIDLLVSLQGMLIVFNSWLMAAKNGIVN